MAKKRQSTREEIEQEAEAELNRSMRGSFGRSQSPYASSPRTGPPGLRGGPPPPPPRQWGEPDDENEGWNDSAEARLSAAEEEEAVTGLAIQQMAERWGGGRAPEDHIMNRMHPSQAEEARDQALRDAVARQARFAKPVRRTPVPTLSSRGFSGSWTSTSPAAESSQSTAWESDMPATTTRPRAVTTEPAKKKAPARKKGPAKRKAPARKVPGKKVAPAKKAPAKKVPAKRSPAKVAPATKVPAKRLARTATAPAKRASPGAKAPAKAVRPRRGGAG